MFKKAFLAILVAVGMGLAGAGQALAVNVLLLADAVNAGVTSLVAALEADGHTVTTHAPEYTYDGLTPALGDFDVVLHFDGATFSSPLPAATQAALVSFVENGGGYIGTQWIGYEERQGFQTGMYDLTLLTWPGPINCSDCPVTYSVVPAQAGHPVVAGVPGIFSYTASHSSGPKAFASNPPTVLVTDQTGSPAVLVREVGAGRVVNFATVFAGYGRQGSFLLQTPEFQTLFRNAVNWASLGQGSRYRAELPDGSRVPLLPISLAGTAAAFYSYSNPDGASANTGLEQEDALVLALVRQANGSIALVSIVDVFSDDDGGALVSTLHADPWSTAYDFLVKDDPGDASSIDDAAQTAEIRLRWAPCCTDGYVFGAFSSREWTLTLTVGGDPALPMDGLNRAVLLTEDETGAIVEAATVPLTPGTGTETIVFNAFTNEPPTAVIAEPDDVRAGVPVPLDGSGSSDPDEDPLTYTWTVEGPPGSTAGPDDPHAVTTTFTPDLLGEYTVTLVVNDGKEDSAPAVLTLDPLNLPPTADAGPDQSVIEIGSTVYLDGSESFDPEGLGLNYLWQFIERPVGSSATLDVPTAVNPSFEADVHGTYRVLLTVTDPFDATGSDEVEISFTNVQPVADAGPNQAVVKRDVVTLSGSGTDANGDPLTFHWSLTTVPEGSSAALTGADTATPSFTADKAGTYVAQLIVNDGFVDSDPATVTVEAITFKDAAIQALMEALETLNGLPPTDDEGNKVFKHRKLRNVLAGKLLIAMKLIDRHNYTAARALLRHALLPKIDGCAEDGSADRNDWIRTCDEQLAVYALVSEALQYLDELPRWAWWHRLGRHRHHEGKWQAWFQKHQERHDRAFRGWNRWDVGFGGDDDDGDRREGKRSRDSSRGHQRR